MTEIAPTPETIPDQAKLVGDLEKIASKAVTIKKGVNRIIFGQQRVIEETLITLLAGGHVLLIGVPGLGKTKLVETLGRVLGLDEKRVQFTPDLMPADILGSEVLEESEGGKRSFRFIQGPVFCQLLMADEINRASPRTQSALLQAMQEHRVSVAGHYHGLPRPFHVLATQNPLEQEGTYPLPEAQLDRFFFKLQVGYSTREELSEILNRTTSGQSIELEPVLDAESILKHQALVRKVAIPPSVQDYAVRIVMATHPGGELATPQVNAYLRFGASPRAAQALVLAAKVKALLAGRDTAETDDVRSVALPAMRHRCLLNFEGEAEGLTTDSVLQNLIATLPADIGVLNS